MQINKTDFDIILNTPVFRGAAESLVRRIVSADDCIEQSFKKGDTVELTLGKAQNAPKALRPYAEQADTTAQKAAQTEPEDSELTPTLRDEQKMRQRQDSAARNNHNARVSANGNKKKTTDTPAKPAPKPAQKSKAAATQPKKTATTQKAGPAKASNNGSKKKA